MAVETLAIPWVRAHKRKSSWKTDIDGEYTVHEQRNKLRSVAQKSWVLTFEKNIADYTALEAFFDARAGRFQAFYWVYSATDKYGRKTGGDGQTYLVRFDTDDLDADVSELGYKTVSVPIVQVMTSE